MRICFVSRRFFPAISGMSIYAINLLRQLVAAGHDVTMISQYRGDAFGGAVYGGGPPPAVPGVRVIGLEALGEQEGGYFESDVDAMVAAIEAEHARAPFDIIHAQYGYPTGWAALIAARRLGVPNLVSIQGGDGHWVGSCCDTHRTAMERVLDEAGALLIGGESFAREVHKRLGTPLHRFTIVPGAVDTNRFTPALARPESGPLRLLYHGRVDRRKGVLDFIRALAIIPQAGWTATISGIGPDLGEARSLADKLLPSRVRFTGYADYDDVPDLYREHDLFVSPTYAEGFSNTILEAMASGLAILSCHAVGVTDCVRDGENGLLVEPGNVVALARALERLIANRRLRMTLEIAGLTEVRNTYSWEVVGRQIGEIYRMLAGSGRIGGIEETIPISPCRFRAEPHLL